MADEERRLVEVAQRGDVESFNELVRLFEGRVYTLCYRMLGDAESAADVTAEVFAAALAARRRYRSESPSAHAWLLAIASNKLNSTLRSGYAERRARARLGMRPVEVTEDDVARIDALAEAAVVATLLEELPAEQRAAVVARVVDERDYADIAVGEGVSETVVRKRVSRGLAGLRRRWEERA